MFKVKTPGLLLWGQIWQHCCWICIHRVGASDYNMFCFVDVRLEQKAMFMRFSWNTFWRAIKWAVRWDFQQSGMCDQQRLRPACAYAQTDQRLCLSLTYSVNVKLLTDLYLEFLSLKGGCTGSSESTLIKMPHCWKSSVMAQMSSGREINSDSCCNVSSHKTSSPSATGVHNFAP